MPAPLLTAPPPPRAPELCLDLADVDGDVNSTASTDFSKSSLPVLPDAGGDVNFSQDPAPDITDTGHPLKMVTLDEATLRRCIREELAAFQEGLKVDLSSAEQPRWQASKACELNTSQNSDSTIAPKGRQESQGSGSVSPVTLPGTIKKSRTLQFEDKGSFYLELEHFPLKKMLYDMFARPIDYLMDATEPKREGRVAELIFGPTFQTTCATVIVLNAIFSLIVTNWEAGNLGNPSVTFHVLEILFLCFYSVEVALKIWVHRFYFFCNEDMSWNIFDLLLVVSGILDQILSGASNLTFMRSLRILKIAKILRVVRLMRMIRGLRLILTSIMGSVSHLAWSIIMMLLVFFIFGTVFVQNVGSSFREVAAGGSTPAEDPDVASDLTEYFGSVQTAMLSLFMASTGGIDWINHYELVGATGIISKMVYLFFIAFIHLALLNILAALFIENALKLAEPDRDLQALEHRKEQIKQVDELTRLCKDFDVDGNGKMDMEQFSHTMQEQGKVRGYLGSLGLDIYDCDKFFGLLLEASPDGEVAIEDFVAGCMQMKGVASALDVQALTYQTKSLFRHTLAHLQRIESRLQ